jgi:MFS family permease
VDSSVVPSTPLVELFVVPSTPLVELFVAAPISSLRSGGLLCRCANPLAAFRWTPPSSPPLRSSSFCFSAQPTSIGVIASDHSRVRALKNPQFRLCAGANLISSTGTWMQLVIQNWLVIDITGSGVALGTTVAVQSAAAMVFGAWGGLLVDRCSRRKVVIVTQVLLAAVALVQAALVWTGSFEFHWILLLAAIAGAINAADGPATSALGAEIVAPQDLASAIAIGSVLHSVGRVAGMAIAGVVLAATGPTAAFLINALSFVPVVLATWRVRPRFATPPVERERGQIRQGIHYVWSHHTIRNMLLLALVFGGVGRNYQVTMATMTNDVFHSSAGAYGLLSIGFAVGAFAGGIVAARMLHINSSKLLLVCGSASVLEIAGGLTPSFAAFFVLLSAIAVSAVIFDTLCQTVCQLSATATHRGRVLATLAVASAGASMAGAWVLGILSDVGGPRCALVTGGSLCLLATLTVGRKALHRWENSPALAH